MSIFTTILAYVICDGCSFFVYFLFLFTVLISDTLLTIYSMLVSSLKVFKADIYFGGAMKLKIENYCSNFGISFDLSC